MRWRVTTKLEKLQKQIDKRCHWHKWFAWHPVTYVDADGATYRMWLEFVGRKDKVYSAMGDMYSQHDAVGLSTYCAIEELLIKALQEPDIIDIRER